MGWNSTTQVRFESIFFYLKTQHDFFDFWKLVSGLSTPGAGGQQMPTPRTRHPVSVSPQKMAWKSWKQSIANKKKLGVLWIIFFWFWKKIGHLDFGTRLQLGPKCFFFQTERDSRNFPGECLFVAFSIGFFLRWKSWSLKWSERRSKNIARRSSLSRIAWFERWRSWRSPSLTLPSVSTWPCSKRWRFLFSPQKYPLPNHYKKGTFFESMIFRTLAVWWDMFV